MVPLSGPATTVDVLRMAQIWAELSDDEKQAFHAYTCLHRTQDPRSVAVVQKIQRRFLEAG